MRTNTLKLMVKKITLYLDVNKINRWVGHIILGYVIIMTGQLSVKQIEQPLLLMSSAGISIVKTHYLPFWSDLVEVASSKDVLLGPNMKQHRV